MIMCNIQGLNVGSKLSKGEIIYTQLNIHDFIKEGKDYVKV